MNNYKLEKRLLELVPYEPTLGNFRIRLDANELYTAPQFNANELQNLLSSLQLNRYPDPTCRELNLAFAKRHAIDPALVMSGNGSDELIALIIELFLSDNMSILSLQPDFSMYGFYAYLRRARNISFNKDQNFNIDIDALIQTIKNEKPKIVIFSNPCNPTGKVILAGDVLNIVKNSGCIVVVDEAYMDFSNQSIIREVSSYPNLIVLKTLSKAYGAAALRLGFAVANADITRLLSAAKSPFNINAISQALGREILNNGVITDQRIREVLNLKTSLFDELSQLKTVFGQSFEPIPSVTNFIYVKTDVASQIYDKLKDDGIIIRRLPQNAIRITVGSEYENNELLNTLRSIS
ncbi:MAG: histidinol-phosphate aminotransferase family protein [Christensenellaceae bacterium]|jgi:histidinol-phosphate aminotransferase|nr:histidinol-phosphate aminotransferase family protein [Christensenellaceae bacterium]